VDSLALAPAFATLYYGRPGRHGALVISTSAPSARPGPYPDPLIVVDGRRMPCPLLALEELKRPTARDDRPAGPYRSEKRLKNNDIAWIEVIKGTTAVRFFGPGTANGVIAIATKRLGVGPPSVSVSPDTSRLRGTVPGVKLPARKPGGRLSSGGLTRPPNLASSLVIAIG
jgi:hypothetical protein